jgi:hypothetical protein
MFVSDTNVPLSHEVYVLDYYVMLLQIFLIWCAVWSYSVVIIKYSILDIEPYHLCIFAVIMQHANIIFFASYHVRTSMAILAVLYFFVIISQRALFSKKKIYIYKYLTWNTCFDFLYNLVVRKYCLFRRNSRIYYH